MRFTTGLLLGGVLGMVGAGVAMQDKRTQRKIVREGKEMAEKAGQFMDDVTEKMHF